MTLILSVQYKHVKCIFRSIHNYSPQIYLPLHFRCICIYHAQYPVNLAPRHMCNASQNQHNINDMNVYKSRKFWRTPLAHNRYRASKCKRLFIWRSDFWFAHHFRTWCDAYFMYGRTSSHRSQHLLMSAPSTCGGKIYVSSRAQIFQLRTTSTTRKGCGQRVCAVMMSIANRGHSCIKYAAYRYMRPIWIGGFVGRATPIYSRRYIAQNNIFVYLLALNKIFLFPPHLLLAMDI